MKKVWCVFGIILAFAFWGNLSVLAAPSDDFVITVKTYSQGATSDNQFEIPTFPEESYDYNVDCDNDGINEAEGVREDYICNYPSPGIYTIRIKDNTGSGDGFPRIYFNNELDKYKIWGINQWGTMHWSSMENAFWGCDSLNDLGTGGLGAAIDSPDLSNVESLANMFREAYSFNQPINSWDTSNVRDMSNMFRNDFIPSFFNQSLDKWDTSNVLYFDNMFRGAQKFNKPLNSWNTSSAITFKGMFYGAERFNQPLDKWNTSNVVDMSYMFSGASEFNQPLNSWDTSNVTDMTKMFAYAHGFNQDLSSWNVSHVVKYKDAFLRSAISSKECIKKDLNSYIRIVVDKKDKNSKTKNKDITNKENLSNTSKKQTFYEYIKSKFDKFLDYLGI